MRPVPAKFRPPNICSFLWVAAISSASASLLFMLSSLPLCCAGGPMFRHWQFRIGGFPAHGLHLHTFPKVFESSALMPGYATGFSNSYARHKLTNSSDKAHGALPRFLAEKLPAKEGLTVQIQGDEFWHMSKVLRLDLNDRVELFDGKGGIVEGLVTRLSRTSVDITAVEDSHHLDSVGPHWHVAAAFGSLKGGRGDWLVEKCTELGATSLIPLLTERSPNVTEKRNDRWHRLALAATKQCQRLHVMTVRDPHHLSSLLLEIASFDVVLIADAYAAPIVKALPPIVNKKSNGLLLVGPEGDFTDKEKEELIKAGAVSVGLGPHRLRVETATIAMLSAVMILSEA